MTREAHSARSTVQHTVERSGVPTVDLSRRAPCIRAVRRDGSRRWENASARSPRMLADLGWALDLFGSQLLRVSVSRLLERGWF